MHNAIVLEKLQGHNQQSFLSNLTRVYRGVDTSVIMTISGHKTMAMFKRYNRIDLDDARDAMRRLEAYLSENQKQEKEKIDFKPAKWNPCACLTE